MADHLPSSVADSPYARSLMAGAELFERVTRRWDQPGFGIESALIDEHEVPVHARTVWEQPFCRLTHFEREGEYDDPRVLVVAPLSGHFASLLRDTVDSLLPKHDVYVTEWANARDVSVTRGCFDLDDYVDYVVSMLQLLGPDTHMLAVCQPVVPVLAAVSLLAADGDPAQPRTMTLMAGPIDARQSPTAVNRFATSQPLSWFEQYAVTTVPSRYEGAGRRVYPGFAQLTAFMSMNPDRHFEAHVQLVDDVMMGRDEAADRHRRFYDEYYSVMDMTAEYYLQTVDRVFQRYDLARGQFVTRDRLVEPAAIHRTALLTVEGERDDITGIGQTRAAHELCENIPLSMRAHHEQPGVGHYGVFSGRRWRSEILPRFADFIRAHGGKRAREGASHRLAARGGRANNRPPRAGSK